MKIEVDLTPQAVAHLRRLLATGLYGLFLEDTAEELIRQGLREQVSTGLLKRKGKA